MTQLVIMKCVRGAMAVISAARSRTSVQCETSPDAKRVCDGDNR